MKAVFKSALRLLLGETRVRALTARLRGRGAAFAESELIAAYFAAHPRCGVMVDVGAHFGESFATYLESGWQVHAFEPDAINRAELHRRIPAQARLCLRDLAVSDHSARDIPFFASFESDGISSLSAFRDTHREVQRVRLVTLSEVLGPEIASRVDYLKIDTEGHDLFVLRGFPWERLRPEVVLCEFEDSKTRGLGYDYRTLGDFLLTRGYRVFLSEWDPIVRYGGAHRWRSLRKYPCELENADGWGNFVGFSEQANTSTMGAYLRMVAPATSVSL